MSKMKAFKRFLTAFIAVVLLTTACTPVALASFKARVNTSTKVFVIPSKSARSIRVPRGLTVTVTGTAGKWARIKYKGHTAYMALSQLNLVKRLTAYAGKSTPIYKKASTSSKKLGTVPYGTAVYVVGKSGSFYRVQNKSGSVTGYVKPGYLTTKSKINAAYKKKSSSGSSSLSGSTKLEKIVNSLLGKKYSSGASLSAAPSKFNCSTFVNYVMGKLGYKMKATAKEQSRDTRYAKITSISSLKAGDILCFDGNNNGVCDHTAIYLGNSKFAEASQTAGKVHINKFSDYYKKHFMWARRPK